MRPLKLIKPQEAVLHGWGLCRQRVKIRLPPCVTLAGNKGARFQGMSKSINNVSWAFACQVFGFLVAFKLQLLNEPLSLSRGIPSIS